MKSISAVLVAIGLLGIAPANLFAQLPVPQPLPPIQEQALPPTVTLPAPTIVALPLPPARIFASPHAARKYQRNLSNCLERQLKQQFGSCVKCVDVDVDLCCNQIRVKGKAKNPLVVEQVQRFLCSLPEMAGYQVRLDLRI